MGMPGRVLLIAGQGGAGTTSLARSTVDAIQADGVTVARIDASGASAQAPDAALVAPMSATLGRLWQEAGADPVVPEAWCGLPGVGLVEAWLQIAGARQEAEAVVVDAGSLVRARDLCALPRTLVHLLDSAMTPRMAMWRSASGAGGLFESLSDLRVAVRAWLAILEDDETSARLVARPAEDSAVRVLEAAAQLAMLGVDVDGIVVNRVPRKDARSEGERVARAAALAAQECLIEGSDGVPVWRATARAGARPRVRPAPKGSAPLARLAESAVPATRASTMVLSSDDDGYRLALPLRGHGRRHARVGVQGDRLVVSLDGLHAWHELPSVLHRCEPVRAVRTPAGLTIHWSPDADVWPQARPAAGSEREAGAGA